MYARALQEAEAELLELHHEEQQRMGVSAVALGASLACTSFFPPLVVPLFVGGLAVGALGVSAIWRHWDLVDRLADDGDAYLIPEVRAYAAREARMDRRRGHAALIRSWTSPPDARVAELVDELEELACALEDEELELEPASAMACRRLVSEPAVSPLLDETAPREDIHSSVARIRAGFRPRTLA
jgi:hypothetical protein